MLQILVHNKLLIKKYTMLYRVQPHHIYGQIICLCMYIKDLMNSVLPPTLYVHASQCNDNKINF